VMASQQQRRHVDPAAAGSGSRPSSAGRRNAPAPSAAEGTKYAVRPRGASEKELSPAPSPSPPRSGKGSPRMRGESRAMNCPPSLDVSKEGLAPAARQERIVAVEASPTGRSGERRWSITVEDAEPEDQESQPLSPLPEASPAGAAASRRVKEFSSEEEQDGFVQRHLKSHGMEPGSPSHKVMQMLKGDAAPGYATRSKRRMSATPPMPPKQEPCPLFPNVPAAPGTEEWVPRLNKLLQGHPANEVLPFAEYHDVMQAASDAARRDKGCPVIEVTKDQPPLSIVGDLHGQLANLLVNVLGPVLQGEMSMCRWLFLGDLVDRGPEGCEVLAIVSLMKICWPNHVWILRGNHEDAPISYVYGFFQECEGKFGTTPDGSVWHYANELFVELPIAAVVRDPETKKRFFCCHGGLTQRLLSAPDVVEMINAAPRVKYGQQRMGEVVPDKGPSSPMASPELTQQLLEGLMWSDPDDGDVYFRPSARGAGEHWGKEASKHFCEKGRFEFICRAHQMVQHGYHRQHKGLVLTVFSAADYCGMGNKGAVLRVEKDKEKGWKHRIAQYEAPAPGMTILQAATPLLPYFRQDSGGSSGSRGRR